MVVDQDCAISLRALETVTRLSVGAHLVRCGSGWKLVCRAWWHGQRSREEVAALEALSVEEGHCILTR